MFNGTNWLKFRYGKKVKSTNGNFNINKTIIARLLPIRTNIDSPTERAVLFVIVDKKNAPSAMKIIGINCMNKDDIELVIYDVFTTCVPITDRSFASSSLNPNDIEHVINDMIYVITPNMMVNDITAKNLDRSIFHLLLGLITSSLIVPF